MTEEVSLPERIINPSDIKIYHMTEKGQEAFRKGIPFLKMIEGEDYTLDFIIDYKALVRQRVRENAKIELGYYENKRPRYSFRQHNTYGGRKPFKSLDEVARNG
mgnify:FL=1